MTCFCRLVSIHVLGGLGREFYFGSTLNSKRFQKSYRNPVFHFIFPFNNFSNCSRSNAETILWNSPEITHYLFQFCVLQILNQFLICNEAMLFVYQVGSVLCDDPSEPDSHSRWKSGHTGPHPSLGHVQPHQWSGEFAALLQNEYRAPHQKSFMSSRKLLQPIHLTFFYNFCMTWMFTVLSLVLQSWSTGKNIYF